MNIPSNCSVDLAQAIRTIVNQIIKHKDYCYPGRSLDSARCHAALIAIGSDANSIIALLDAVKDTTPT